MNTRKRKAIMDDGMNPELVKGAIFDGIFEIPTLRAPKHILIPDGITPFTFRNRDGNNRKEAISFNEVDVNFSEILIQPEMYLEDIRKYAAMISPDCSLYRDAPLAVQIANVYRNRAIGFYYQKNGIYVIPQIRWGTEENYTTKVLPEKVAFLGAPKHSIVAVGTYGCISDKENKYYFQAGLEAMLEELEPVDVLVYGSMPSCIFDSYLRHTRFHQYDDWTTRKRGER